MMVYASVKGEEWDEEVVGRICKVKETRGKSKRKSVVEKE